MSLGNYSSQERQFGLQILLSVQVVSFLLNPENSCQFGQLSSVVWISAQRTWMATNSHFTENHVHSWKVFSWSWTTQKEVWQEVSHEEKEPWQKLPMVWIEKMDYQMILKSTSWVKSRKILRRGQSMGSHGELKFTMISSQLCQYRTLLVLDILMKWLTKVY